MNNNKNMKNRINSKPKKAQRQVAVIPRDRALFQQMPSEVHFALNETRVEVISGPGIYQYIWGLFEYLGRKPAYLPEMYTIYRYSKITAVTVECEIVNTATFPVTIAYAPIPFRDIDTTLTTIALSERPRSVYKILGGSAGQNRAHLAKTYRSVDELGQPVYDKAHWVTQTQASVTTPVDIEAPVIAAIVNATNADSLQVIGVVLQFKVTFHVRFFDLIRPALS